MGWERSLTHINVSVLPPPPLRPLPCKCLNSLIFTKQLLQKNWSLINICVWKLSSYLDRITPPTNRRIDVPTKHESTEIFTLIFFNRPRPRAPTHWLRQCTGVTTLWKWKLWKGKIIELPNSALHISSQICWLTVKVFIIRLLRSVIHNITVIF